MAMGKILWASRDQVLSLILIVSIFLLEDLPPFLGTSMFTPAVIIVEITMKKISNKKTKSVIEDMPPSILILFSDLKFMDYFPGASRMSINSIDAPSIL